MYKALLVEDELNTVLVHRKQHSQMEKKAV